MHRDVGLGKLGQAWEEVAPWLLGNGHDQVGGSHPIHRLIQAVQPTQDGDRVGSRMNGQVPASRPRLGQMMVAGVHEADDRHAPPGCPVQVMKQLPGVAPGPDQNDPVPRRATDSRRFVRFRMLQGIIHELPPIHRSPSRRGELAGGWTGRPFGTFMIRAAIHGRHVFTPFCFNFLHRPGRRYDPVNPFSRWEPDPSVQES